MRIGSKARHWAAIVFATALTALATWNLFDFSGSPAAAKRSQFVQFIGMPLLLSGLLLNQHLDRREAKRRT